MKSLVLQSAGLNPIFEIEDRDYPHLPDNGVIVKVRAIGLCYHDISIIDGTLSRGVKNNLVLGHEVSGSVVDVGNDSLGLEIGQKVVVTLTSSCGTCEKCCSGADYRCDKAFGFGHGIDGGMSEFIAVDSKNVIPVPAEHDLISASLYGCPMGVAVNSLSMVPQITEQDKVVVFGVGGGLGIHAAQIAVSKGAEVISFTSSEHKYVQLEKLPIGQLFLIDDGLDVAELVFAMTEDHGADIIFNPVGSAMFEQGVQSLANKGHMLITGEIKGKNLSVNAAELIFRDAVIMGASGANAHNIRQVIKLVSDHKIRPVVGAEFGISEILEAITKIKSKEILGRSVIVF
jgi:acryloyl-coenzyme A reductase